MVEKNTEFGNGFTERNLQIMRQFYFAFPIPHTLCAELSWSHIGSIMRLDDADSNLYIVLSFPQRRESRIMTRATRIMTKGNQEGDRDE